VFKARCEGPTQFVWWGDVLKAAYIVQLRTWSPAEVDEWIQLIGCNQTDLFSTRNVDGAKLLSCRAREDLHKLLGLMGAHAGAWRQDVDRVYNAVSAWRTAGSKAKLQSMNDHLANVGSRRKLRDYEAATQYVIAKCIETVEFEGAPGGADSVTAPGSKPEPGPAGGANQVGQHSAGPAGQGAVDTSISHAVEYLTCGWLEKQSGGHTDLGGSQKRKLTFGQVSYASFFGESPIFGIPNSAVLCVCSTGSNEVGHSILCSGIGSGIIRLSSQLLSQPRAVASSDAPKG